MFEWFAETLRRYPEIAIFLSLAIGYFVGKFTYRGPSASGPSPRPCWPACSSASSASPISPNVKSVFFLMFLFAVGYGVGPQFVRGIAEDGLPQAIFAACLRRAAWRSALSWRSSPATTSGSAAGLYAGVADHLGLLGLATDAINRLGLPPDRPRRCSTHAGRLCGDLHLRHRGLGRGPGLSGRSCSAIDLEEAARTTRPSMGGSRSEAGAGSAWHRFELRAFRVASERRVVGQTVAGAEALLPGRRVFVERIRRGGRIDRG